MSPRAGDIRRSVRSLRLDRRTVLRGMVGGLGISVGLPLLETMLDGNGTALANGDPLPRRFGVFFWGGGMSQSAWVPTTTGMSWTPPASLQPFAAEGLLPYLTVVSGTSHAGSSPGHIPSRGIALSSSHDMTVNTGSQVGTYRGQNHPEPSIDALVHEHWSDKPLVAIGICRKGPYASNSSWQRGGKTYNRHEPSPQALFDRLFGQLATGGAGSGADGGTDPGVLARTRAFRQSMLDAVQDDTQRLTTRLGAADRRRMEQHLEGVRALELRLQERDQMPMAAEGCTVPDAPGTLNFGDGGSHEEKEAKNALMSELLAHALACDLTRVFSYEFSATQSHAVYWEVGITDEHHPLTHSDNGGPKTATVTTFIMKNFAHLAARLKAMPEGTGNVLDNTLMLATSEHANAGSHNYTDHPYLLVGKASGGINAGMHFRGTSGSSPRVLLTAVRALGLPVEKLGQANSDGNRVATAPFSELLKAP